MNRSALRLISLSLVLPLSGWFVASAMTPARVQDPKPAPQGRGGDPRDGERPGPGGDRRGGRGGPSLHRAMEQMEEEVKRIYDTIADPAQEATTLSGLGRLIQYAGASQSGEPKNLGETPAEAKAAHKAAFLRALTVFARDVAEVELLVLDGKHAEAKKVFDTKVLGPVEAAHVKFGVQDEHHDEPKKPGDAPK